MLLSLFHIFFFFSLSSFLLINIQHMTLLCLFIFFHFLLFLFLPCSRNPLSLLTFTIASYRYSSPFIIPPYRQYSSSFTIIPYSLSLSALSITLISLYCLLIYALFISSLLYQRIKKNRHYQYFVKNVINLR